jgi:hypothetical protein
MTGSGVAHRPRPAYTQPWADVGGLLQRPPLLSVGATPAAPTTPVLAAVLVLAIR